MLNSVKQERYYCENLPVRHGTQHTRRNLIRQHWVFPLQNGVQVEHELFLSRCIERMIFQESLGT